MGGIQMDKLFERGLTKELLVLAIDMCSSSKLIEGLAVKNNLVAFDKLLQNLYIWIKSNTKKYNYEIYQFTGDGWILLFPTEKLDGLTLMNFLVKVSQMHNKLRETFIDIHLESMPESTGLTFGVEKGELHKFRLGGEVRYVGHALNVACKLQDAVKQKGPESSINYRGLISRGVYNSILKRSAEISEFKFFDVTRSLRNINPKYRCLRVNLSDFVSSHKTLI